MRCETVLLVVCISGFGCSSTRRPLPVVDSGGDGDSGSSRDSGTGADTAPPSDSGTRADTAPVVDGAMLDAGPCGVCPPARPLCDEASGSCIECVSSGDCLGSRTICDRNACVECTADDETACGADVCDLVGATCSGASPGSASMCEPCVSDRQCTAGQLCVEMFFDGSPAGHRCLWRETATEPGGPNGSCFNVRGTAWPRTVTSLGGVSGDVCTPRWTTCDALVAYGSACTTDSDCGAPGVDDGECRSPGSTVDSRCTFVCESNYDCPGGLICDIDRTTPPVCFFVDS